MANKKAVLSRPTPDATVPRNCFDRESMRVYHYALGQLIPAWFEPVIAGSHMKLNRKIFQRTASLKTAAFPLIDTHIQYYFVPFRQLWSLWDDFKLGIKDVNSTSLVANSHLSANGNVTLPSRVPYTNLSDLETVLLNIQTDSGVDIFGNPILDSSKKLLNLLGYGFPNYGSLNIDVNLWPLLAYHKIYYDHFRNSSYELNDAKKYNMDFLWPSYSNMKLSSTLMYDSVNKKSPWLEMHYVDYRNDYFTNMYPSLTYIQANLPYPNNAGLPGTMYTNPIGLPLNISGLPSGSSISVSGNTGVDGSWTRVNDTSTSTQSSDLDNSLYQVVGQAHPWVADKANSRFDSVSHTHPITGVSISSSAIAGAINAQSIRSLFALDKLQRSWAYAGQHAKNQYEARFGIKFKNNPNESIFIGAFKNDIQIGEVTSTANTVSGSNGDTLGAIGGKGVGFDDWGKTLEFTAQEDGIVMAIQYSTIRSCYRSLGIDSYLTKHLPEDYFQPEFMNLGLEPVYGYEFSQSLGSSTVLGFRPRNQRYKLGIDKSFGLFADTTQDLSMFINHTDMHRLPSVGQQGVNYSWFKVQPSDLDSVMEVVYDGSWSTDHFFGQTVFGCTVNQNMSVHGQPSL